LNLASLLGLPASGCGRHRLASGC